MGRLVKHFHEIILQIHPHQNAFVKRISCDVGFVQENMRVMISFHKIFTRFLAFCGPSSKRKTVCKEEVGSCIVYSHRMSCSLQQLLLVKNYTFQLHLPPAKSCSLICSLCHASLPSSSCLSLGLDPILL